MVILFRINQKEFHLPIKKIKNEGKEKKKTFKKYVEGGIFIPIRKDKIRRWKKGGNFGEKFLHGTGRGIVKGFIYPLKNDSRLAN